MDDDGLVDVLYQRRFTSAGVAAKDAVWSEICRYLQRYVRESDRVLEVACDRGYFIRHIRARERWASDIRNVSDALPQDIRFVQADGLSLAERVPVRHFDVVFASNYLEHLPDHDAVVRQLQVIADLLAPGGRAIILQPNIRLVGAAYWDFIDHRVPLTERSLAEAGALAGLRQREMVVRFLPYTTKARLPAHPRLARWYLRLRPLWWLLGGQTLYIAERPIDA